MRLTAFLTLFLQVYATNMKAPPFPAGLSFALVETADTLQVSASMYHAVPAQTDDTPLVTADNSVINRKKLRQGKLKWLAISRDLQKIYNFGDTVEIQTGDARYRGRWVVRDVMNKRFTNAVDFLVPATIYGTPKTVRLIRPRMVCTPITFYETETQAHSRQRDMRDLIIDF
jgi:3D (Asp-Asp-Asp) domain-containing protein